jgi:hypothetical protein
MAGKRSVKSRAGTGRGIVPHCPEHGNELKLVMHMPRRKMLGHCVTASGEHTVNKSQWVNRLRGA